MRQAPHPARERPRAHRGAHRVTRRTPHIFSYGAEVPHVAPQFVAERRLLCRFPLVAQKMRSLVTAAFKEKQNTTDVTTINRLIIQGRMELEETLMLWKGPSHVRPPPHTLPLRAGVRARGLVVAR